MVPVESTRKHTVGAEMPRLVRKGRFSSTIILHLSSAKHIERKCIVLDGQSVELADRPF